MMLSFSVVPTHMLVDSREWETLAGSRTITASNSGNTWPSCVLTITKSGRGESLPVPSGRAYTQNPLCKGNLLYLNTLIPSVTCNKAWVTIITLYDDFINSCF